MNQTLHRNIKALILDMDGVLWRDEQPIGDLPAIFATIQNKGLNVTLCTNNATLSVGQYIKKLQRFGVALKPEQIVNSSQAAVHYLKNVLPDGSQVYPVGEDGLVQTLIDAGYSIGGDNVLAVVAGLDRHLTYDKINRATHYIRSGAIFVGTNSDKTFPTPAGLAPGAGAVLAAIEAATSVEPIVLGKPNPEMYEIAMLRMGITPEHTLVVGDRLDTDIVGAQKLGCLCGLVLSGVSTADAASVWLPQPDFIAADLTSLLDTL
jgi:4-nitrophenyl phosphatase